MAKQGIHIGKLDSIIKSIDKRGGWTLCIGAGISQPIFPDWNELVRRLLEKDSQINEVDETVKWLIKSYSPDALIQAAKERLGYQDEEFIKLMSEELYKDLFNKLNESEIENFISICEAPNAHIFKDREWKKFIKVRDKYFSSTSSYQIAQVIFKAWEKKILPSALLSFNAEPILYALVNSFIREKFLGKERVEGEMPVIFDRITNSTSNRNSKHIPYIYCHGLLAIPQSKAKYRGTSSHEKLVFLESEYLQLANNTFSWQANSFLNYANNTSIVFIGVSLTDSNMRRWLSWTHSMRVNDCHSNANVAEEHTRHYWINKCPNTEEKKLCIEASVAHLGVRLIWIEKWNQVGEALEKMII